MSLVEKRKNVRRACTKACLEDPKKAAADDKLGHVVDCSAAHGRGAPAVTVSKGPGPGVSFEENALNLQYAEARHVYMSGHEFP